MTNTPLVIIYRTIYAACIVALLVTIAPPAAAQSTEPRCNFKIGTNQIQDDISPEVHSGTSFYTQCRLSGDFSILEASTELDEVIWKLDNETIGSDREVTAEFSGSGVLELWGTVPWSKVSVSAAEGAESYEQHLAPPITVRVLSFRQGAGPYTRIETRAVHPKSSEAQEAVMNIQNIATDDKTAAAVAPLIDAAQGLIDSGRPWSAIELLDASDEIVNNLQERNQATSGVGLFVFGLIIGIVVGAVAVVVIILFRMWQRTDDSRAEDDDDADEDAEDDDDNF